MDQIVKLPNRVPEMQRAMQNDPRPPYLKGPRGRLYLSAFTAGLTVGLAGISYGLVTLIQGKKAE